MIRSSNEPFLSPERQMFARLVTVFPARKASRAPWIIAVVAVLIALIAVMENVS